jgi:hypothetical protein
MWEYMRSRNSRGRFSSGKLSVIVNIESEVKGFSHGCGGLIIVETGNTVALEVRT